MSAAVQFLESAAFLIFLVGCVTAIVWLRSKRKLPAVTSYQRAILLLIRFVGLGGMVISGFCLLLALSDQMGITHFGYPLYFIPVSVLSVIVGYGIQTFAARGLRYTQTSN